MGSPENDAIEVRPEDALQVAQRALAKANDAEEMDQEILEEIDALRHRVVELELRLSEIDEDRPYDSLTLDEKIGKVREHAFNRATEGHGKATLTYDDVMWSVFNGEPGPAHCYKLMRRAAGVDDEGNTVQDIPGFKFQEDTRPMRLAVDADRAKRGAAFFAENKTRSEEVS